MIDCLFSQFREFLLIYFIISIACKALNILLNSLEAVSKAKFRVGFRKKSR
jgi:hypothetical protein